MSLVISSRAVARWLGATVAALVALDVVHHVLYRVFHRDVAFGFHTAFSLSGEQNVPTWYASGALLLSAALFCLIAHAKRAARDPFARHWQGLGAIFVLLSLDEAAALHDGLNMIATSLGSGGGVFRWGWVLFAMAAVLGVGLAYLRFFTLARAALPAAVLRGRDAVRGWGGGLRDVGAAQWQEDAMAVAGLRAHLVARGDARDVRDRLLVYALLAYITATLPNLTIRFHGGAAPRPTRSPSPRRSTPVPAPGTRPSRTGDRPRVRRAARP